MNKRVLIIILLLTLVLGCLGGNKEGIEFPISGEKALEIVESNQEAEEFIKENFENESNRITRVALAWDQPSDGYLWKIEIMERSCGCMIEGMEGLNVIKADVDPNTGKILDIVTRQGVKEEDLAKERCMEGCHTTDDKVEKLKIT